MRILQVNNLEELERVMHEIKVDPYGIKIMRLKGLLYLIKIDSISNVSANILKQQMLSLGGDAAVSRDALTGKAKRTDCLLIGNLAQINQLSAKLIRQPFGLGSLSGDILQIIQNYQKSDFIVPAGSYKLNCSQRTRIMGIVNLTPDSFSGDGLYKNQKLEVRSKKLENKRQKNSTKSIIDYVSRLVEDGTDIIDIGGESTRPGAIPVSVKEEIRRTAAVIKDIRKKIKVPISIDTYKPEVAKAALDNGAVMINDITGLKNPGMLKLAAQYKAAVVIMHMKGRPRNMQKNPQYVSVIGEIIAYLCQAVERAQETGIAKNRIIIDPGIGFGKTLEHNLEIIRNLREFRTLGYPVLIGPSRKSFIGKILDTAAGERLSGTIAVSVLAAQNGANFLRVHDVLQIQQALKVTNAIINYTEKCGDPLLKL